MQYDGVVILIHSQCSHIATSQYLWLLQIRTEFSIDARLSKHTTNTVCLHLLHPVIHNGWIFKDVTEEFTTGHTGQYGIQSRDVLFQLLQSVCERVTYEGRQRTLKRVDEIFHDVLDVAIHALFHLLSVSITKLSWIPLGLLIEGMDSTDVLLDNRADLLQDIAIITQESANEDLPFGVKAVCHDSSTTC